MPCERAPRIFVVDDDPLIATSLAAILNQKGFSARYFAQPLDVLAAAQGDVPDLLISDVAMPGLSGIELAIQMAARHPACKVLLFSGQAGTMDLLQDARARGHDFRLFAKPVHPDDFLEAIQVLQLKRGPQSAIETDLEPAANVRDAQA